MTSSDILKQLQSLGTEQTRKTYARHGITGNVYGVSFGDLAKLTKKIKKNHALALELWQSGNADARNLALMVADPKAATEKNLESWIQDVNNTLLADLLAGFIQKTEYATQFIDTLIADDREYHQIVGWNLVAAVANNDTQLPDDYFEKYLQLIQSKLQSSANLIRYAMNKALISLGGRTQELKHKAQIIAREIGPVIVDHGQTNCKTPDAYEYIERIWVRKKL